MSVSEKCRNSFAGRRPTRRRRGAFLTVLLAAVPGFAMATTSPQPGRQPPPAADEAQRTLPVLFKVIGLVAVIECAGSESAHLRNEAR